MAYTKKRTSTRSTSKRRSVYSKTGSNRFSTRGKSRKSYSSKPQTVRIVIEQPAITTATSAFQTEKATAKKAMF